VKAAKGHGSFDAQNSSKAPYVVRVSGAAFGGWEIELRGTPRAVQHYREMLERSFAGDPDPVFEEEVLTDALDDPWIKDAMSRLVPARVLQLRLANSGLTRAQMAKNAGIPDEVLSMLLQRKRKITKEIAASLAKVLGCDAHDFHE